MSETIVVAVMGVLGMGCLVFLMRDAQRFYRHQFDRWEAEREQLLNRIQEPQAAVLNSLDRQAPDVGRPIGMLESREPTASQLERQERAVEISDRLAEAGVSEGEIAAMQKEAAARAGVPVYEELP